MNPKIQQLLCRIACESGAELKFDTGLPIRLYDSQDSEHPVGVIYSDLPPSELISRVLREVRLYHLNSRPQKPFPMPFFVNRPYENEFAGDVAYKTRRALKRFCGKEWQADLWAFCAYYELGCPNEFKAFLADHPEKAKLMCFLKPAIWKIRLLNCFQKLINPFKVKATPP
jgi:hypothetical protein